MMKTKTASAVLAIIALTALSACTTDPKPNPTTSTTGTTTASTSPTPTPSTVAPPTPVTSNAPASSEQAIETAGQAAIAYFKMGNIIAQESGANPQRIAPFATDRALEVANAQAKNYATQQFKMIGFYNVTVSHDQSTASDLAQQNGTAVRFGEVILNTCVDISTAKFLDGSGNAVPDKDNLPRRVVNVTVGYNPADKTWKVVDTSGAPVAC
ncbi:hypothetical protein [Paenarthrobacter nicotinovorans]|uniref:hypothetical protein n=1 Tax=Paenarthrobacter nicotinovorans TaxID=29320 RepID=UPI0011AA3D99|nr:hypothetical protein [Paenarthrobacter nicotinovorans]